jgi:hypothetical protein
MNDDVDDEFLMHDVDFMTPEDLEQEKVFFDLLFDNLEAHEDRYRAQAQALIKLKEIEISNGHLMLNFSLEGKGCAFRISQDGGFDYLSLGWTSVDRKKEAKMKSLMLYFAECEARISMEYSE